MEKEENRSFCDISLIIGTPRHQDFIEMVREVIGRKHRIHTLTTPINDFDQHTQTNKHKINRWC